LIDPITNEPLSKIEMDADRFETGEGRCLAQPKRAGSCWANAGGNWRRRRDAAVGSCGRSGRYPERQLWFYIRNFGMDFVVIVTGSAAGCATRSCC
jgi:hypothetical protein